MQSLVLADGTEINPADGTVVEQQDTSLVTPDPIPKRKRLADLPAAPKQMNALGVYFMYSTLGLTQEEIASAMGVTIDVLSEMNNSTIFKQFREDMLNAIIEADAEGVRAFLAAHARVAAREVVVQLKSKSERTRRDVARDILDRSGHRPADVIEHRLQVSGGLRIEYVEKKEAPIIDVEVL